ncbi:MAG: class I SAM-dependent methyltransferase [Kiritimatiellae bacterium]|nr:class I SAM-dependent methyltransferase [Kiritimatiellia bacterium]
MTDDYELIDSGDGRKFERFGAYTLVRPCSQAMWRPRDAAAWRTATASFDREDGNRWRGRGALPKEWTIETAGIRFKLGGTDFGHLGIFPEQREQWKWIRATVASRINGPKDPKDLEGVAGCKGLKDREPVSVLNLFAYSGGSTIAAAQGGAEVCHLDAAKGMVQWARENAALNGLQDRPVRWIADDAHKFLRREVRRGRRYDAVILDPPTFGRGANGELYKIERDLQETLGLVRDVLSEKPLFVLFSSHTPGLSCRVAENIVRQSFPACRSVETGEMLLGTECPSGVYCRGVF